MIKKASLLFLFLITLAFTIEPGYIYYRSLFFSGGYFATDNLGSFYFLKDDVLEKYDSLGNVLRTYNDKKLGSITSVDVSNPLKIVAFYKEFSEVVLLDNMLTKQAEPLRLNDIGIEQPFPVCFSFNGLWVFDAQTRELIQIDNERKKARSSGNLAQLLKEDVQPNFLTENNNYVYLNDPKKGIFIFDIYASYFKTIPIKGLKNFKVMEDEIIYFSDNKLNSYNIKTLEQKIQMLPDSAINACIEKGRLFLQKKDSLKIYRVL